MRGLLQICLAIVLVLGATTTINSQPKVEFISAELVAINLQGNDNIVPNVIDLRSPADYNLSHIPKAININANDEEYWKPFLSLDRNQSYVLYVEKGGLSTSVFMLMKQFGFSDVAVLEGGYLEWRDKGLPMNSAISRQ